MANNVILLDSSEVGAPTLNNAAGSLVALLDAVLITGFNVKSCTINVASNVATVTCAGHGYTDGRIVEISGCAVTALNGNKLITVTGGGSFTFPAPGVSDGSAGGSPQAKRSPCGGSGAWTKTAGSNKAIYTRSSGLAPTQSLRVDDPSAGTSARVIMVESFTDIDTYTGAAPTSTQLSGGQHWNKGANTAAAKVWAVVGDERSFYFFCEPDTNSFASTGCLFPHAFGECGSFRPSDSYRSFLSGAASAGGGATSYLFRPSGFGASQSPGGAMVLSRRETGLGSAIAAWSLVHNAGASSGVPASAEFPIYPSPVDNGLVVQYPIHIGETASSATTCPVRGVLPGCAAPLADMSQLGSQLYLQLVTGIVGLSRTFVAIPIGHTSFSASTLRGMILMDLTGPWQ